MEKAHPYCIAPYASSVPHTSSHCPRTPVPGSSMPILVLTAKCTSTIRHIGTVPSSAIPVLVPHRVGDSHGSTRQSVGRSGAYGVDEEAYHEEDRDH
eukprot:4299-Rhodomonas_salina.2